LSDAEVARRAGLAERRYGHYVRGAREPDLQTLLRICTALDVTPNDLLMPASSSSRLVAHEIRLAKTNSSVSPPKADRP
jgi:transcriptional regulator with XRE-family HTH domain